ncbi:hypothetical protein MSP7336_00555 [Mycobacterium shimoidei]|uniref:Uncharacterized protein n=1 Tax=Mycobacterium shimoidei TaxID=29313 RepID=A0A375YUE3_MYCSH|nr:hypothetical protein MSP7336_00555 [Mycobacterium shimoidei]
MRGIGRFSHGVTHRASEASQEIAPNLAKGLKDFHSEDPRTPVHLHGRARTHDNNARHFVASISAGAVLAMGAMAYPLAIPLAQATPSTPAVPTIPNEPSQPQGTFGGPFGGGAPIQQQAPVVPVVPVAPQEPPKSHLRRPLNLPRSHPRRPLNRPR